MIEQVPSWWPMAGYALGFAMGATSVIRFSFYREFLSRRGRSNNHRRTSRMGPPSGSYGLPPELDRRFGVPFDEGRVQRGNGSGGPTTPKPDIIPKPQFPPPRIIREDFLP